MYSGKEDILQLIVLLRTHGVTKVVLCPENRNTPIVHALAGYPDSTCYSVTSKWNVGLLAIGLTLHDGKPATVCCTSGTALLSLYPAATGAYYQKIPLIVIPADRLTAWINQMDGQILPQPGVFQLLVKMSADLPGIHTDEDKWYCSRLLNEVLLELNHHGRGPMYINVPVSEPLFQFTADVLPGERVITRYQGLDVYDRDYDGLIDRLNKYNRHMMIVGQMNLIYLFEKKYSKMLYKQFAWFTEYLSNQTVPGVPIRNFDAVLYAMSSKMQEKTILELIITYGGHIVSRRMKKFLRQYPPKEHWHVSMDGGMIDLFQGSLTATIEVDPFEFLEKIAFLLDNRTSKYPWRWGNFYKELPQPELPYSEMSAIGALIKALPASCVLHLANNSVVHHAQLYPLPDTIGVCYSRGTNGIEGSLSTAVSYAATSGKLNFVVTEDLSFFYDMNTLWSNHFGGNLRVLLLNSERGEILHTLPGSEMSGTSHRFMAAVHRTSARGWAEECGFPYQEVQDENQLDEAMKVFTQAELLTQPVLMEIFTNKNKGAHILKDYYHQLKK